MTEHWWTALWATGIISTLAMLYAGACVLFYFAQDYFFFRPERLPADFAYKYPFPFEELHFDMEDGAKINGIYFKVPNSKGIIYYFKGNSRSIKGWGKFARDFVGKGYDFLLVDYRGFGKSKGRRTEANIYNDMQDIYNWVHERYPEQQIVIYGRSLGSGFAARIASWNKPKMLILDCPYFSFYHQVRMYLFWLPIQWLLRYQVRTDQFVKKIKCPIFILHGKKDRLIPFSQSERLIKVTSASTVLYPIQRAGHNNLPSFSEYHEHLYNILNDDDLFQEVANKTKRNDT